MDIRDTDKLQSKALLKGDGQPLHGTNAQSSADIGKTTISTTMKNIQLDKILISMANLQKSK